MQVLSTDLSTSMSKIHPIAESLTGFSGAHIFEYLQEQVLPIYFESCKCIFAFHLNNKNKAAHLDQHCLDQVGKSCICTSAPVPKSLHNPHCAQQTYVRSAVLPHSLP